MRSTLKPIPLHRAVRRTQRGAALLVMAVILVLGTSGVLLSALNVASSSAEIARRAASGRALAEAKLALLGYVAMKASNDTSPGRLPCPEAAGYYGDAAYEGIASGFCTLPAVGRLPWRTLGLSKLTDGYGEPLWYVVSPGFALPSSGASVSINSNTPAQLTLDNGTAPAAVALIIAPGPPISVESAAGCTPRVQSHSGSPPDLRDYLECENASTESSPGPYKFVTTGPATSFNDQVVSVTQAELFDAVEPVVARRVGTEIAPVLKTVYAGADWNLPDSPSATYIYPYAVTFTDPTASPFQGTSGATQGLLPIYAAGGTSTFVYWYDGSSSRRPTVVKLGSAGTISGTPSCAATTTTTVSCIVVYKGNPRILITAQARSVARTMRQLNKTAGALNPSDANYWADLVNPNLTVTAAFDTSTSNGRASVYVTANLPDYTGAGWTSKTVAFPIGVLADHPLTDPNNAATGWFVKNNWHHLVYYAFAPEHAADQSHSCNNDAWPPSGSSSFCLTVKTPTDPTPTGNTKAVLILTGRAVTTKGLPAGAVRTQLRSNTSENSDLTNYFEDTENGDGDKLFVQNTISKTSNNAFNDRVIVVDSN